MERSKGLNNRKPVGGGKRTEAQRVSDIAYCAVLFRQGLNYRQMADRLNERNAAQGLDYTVNHAQVHQDLRKHQDEWFKDIAENISLYYTQELAKLDHMEREAMDAWERSKAAREKTKIAGGVMVKGSDKIEGGTIKERESATTDGDPRYLKLALDVIQQRDKLLERAYNSVLRKPADAPGDMIVAAAPIPEELRQRLVAHLQGIPALPEQPPVDEVAEAISSETRYEDGPTYTDEPEYAEAVEVDDEPGQQVLTLDDDE